MRLLLLAVACAEPAWDYGVGNQSSLHEREATQVSAAAELARLEERLRGQVAALAATHAEVEQLRSPRKKVWKSYRDFWCYQRGGSACHWYTTRSCLQGECASDFFPASSGAKAGKPYFYCKAEKGKESRPSVRTYAAACPAAAQEDKMKAEADEPKGVMPWCQERHGASCHYYSKDAKDPDAKAKCVSGQCKFMTSIGFVCASSAQVHSKKKQLAHEGACPQPKEAPASPLKTQPKEDTKQPAQTKAATAKEKEAAKEGSKEAAKADGTEAAKEVGTAKEAATETEASTEPWYKSTAFVLVLASGFVVLLGLIGFFAWRRRSIPSVGGRDTDVFTDEVHAGMRMDHVEWKEM